MRRRLKAKLVREAANRRHWEQQSWEMSDAILRASDLRSDMQLALQSKNGELVGLLAAAEERANQVSFERCC